MGRYKVKRHNKETQYKVGEVIEIRVKSYFGKVTFSGKYDVNNEHEMFNLTYYLVKGLNLPIEAMCKKVKRFKE